MFTFKVEEDITGHSDDCEYENSNTVYVLSTDTVKTGNTNHYDCGSCGQEIVRNVSVYFWGEHSC